MDEQKLEVIEEILNKKKIYPLELNHQSMDYKLIPTFYVSLEFSRVIAFALSFWIPFGYIPAYYFVLYDQSTLHKLATLLVSIVPLYVLFIELPLSLWSWKLSSDTQGLLLAHFLLGLVYILWFSLSINEKSENNQTNQTIQYLQKNDLVFKDQKAIYKNCDYTTKTTRLEYRIEKLKQWWLIASVIVFALITIQSWFRGIDCLLSFTFLFLQFEIWYLLTIMLCGLHTFKHHMSCVRHFTRETKQPINQFKDIDYDSYQHQSYQQKQQEQQEEETIEGNGEKDEKDESLKEFKTVFRFHQPSDVVKWFSMHSFLGGLDRQRIDSAGWMVVLCLLYVSGSLGYYLLRKRPEYVISEENVLLVVYNLLAISWMIFVISSAQYMNSSMRALSNALRQKKYEANQLIKQLQTKLINNPNDQQTRRRIFDLEQVIELIECGLPLTTTRDIQLGPLPASVSWWTLFIITLPYLKSYFRVILPETFRNSL